MSEMNIRERIAEHLLTAGLTQEQADDIDLELFESGLLSSIDLLSLVIIVEDIIGDTLNGESLELSNFGSVRSMEALIHRAASGRLVPEEKR